MILAGMLPLGLLGLAGFRKRLMNTRGALLLLACVLTIGGLAGCGGMKSTTGAVTSSPGTPTPTPTPTMSQVTINATSGSLTHSVVVALTVN
jgi:hypothetical protein